MKRNPALTSLIMSHIHGQNTIPEMILGSAMFKLGLRYRKQIKIIGKPDFGIKKYKVAIFVDGEFWHGRKWINSDLSNLECDLIKYGKYWVNKIRKNIERDNRVNNELIRLKWKVFRFWDTEVKSNPYKCAKKVQKYINKKKENKALTIAST